MSEGSIRANPLAAARAGTTVPHAAEAGPGPGRPAPQAAAPTRALLPSLVPLLREWLPRQRWFAGKGSPITGFSLVSATELLPPSAGGATPGLLHLLVRAEQDGPASRPGARGGPAADCYQLLLGIRASLPPHLAHALIGRPTGGPLHGRTVYEALHDPRLAGLLLERLRVPGRLGGLRFTRAPGTSIGSGLTPRLITAEQSNSSVVYGDAYILKVFRRIGTGVNPDLELPLALAGAGCDRVPHPTAWFEAEPAVEAAAGAGLGTAPADDDPDGGPLTLGILQPFLPGSADGWQLAMNSLSVRADFTGAARALGRATAEVHTALAAALPTAVLRGQQTELIAQGMTDRLEAAAAAVPALRPYRERLRTAFDDFAALGRRGRTWHAQRIHGDLHLGQSLRTAHDGRWALIDFEGEPARPISERRRLQPVARDIAGMLRSFDYAARTHHPAPDTSRWAQQWSLLSRAAYCDGYAEAAGTDPRDEPELLRAYETDKAVYEVLYEARHRPDWLPVPMAAIRRLAGSAEETAGAADGRPTPDRPGRSDRSDRSASADFAGPADPADRPGRSAPADRPNRSDLADRSGRSDPADRSGRRDRSGGPVRSVPDRRGPSA
ncbi:maltokinase N-terminal cap-like domain-containing protein [Streptomyces lycii]|uniref:maltokinase N-terminal cap-like domain-containing protein n=1 Tax=Streptomyces lycii TaxID=2654337 RepID=UPI001C3FF3A5|nr:maltokinase [Streptomyces lycii]